MKVMNTVKMSSRVLSSQSLILVLQTLITLICGVYLFIDWVMSPSNQLTLMQCATNISGALSAAVALWILNGQSEEVKQSLSNLKDTLGKGFTYGQKTIT